jgi:hypothetical protein
LHKSYWSRRNDINWNINLEKLFKVPSLKKALNLQEDDKLLPPVKNQASTHTSAV